MTNTALGATSDANTQTITFRGQKHKEFYFEYLQKCRHQDVYHKALVYCLGIDEDTRNNVNAIYDFKTGYVNTDCLHDGWITSGSAKIVRLAFNLYCNGTPSVFDYEEKKDFDGAIYECRQYTVEDLFCCSYSPYFMEAIRVRYPEYNRR